MATTPLLSHHDYTIGWISALPLEAAAARAMRDEEHPELHQRVPGTNAATMVATQMLRSYTQVKFCMLVGIGGGVPGGAQDIRLGDVAVGLKVVQYDMGKTVQGGKFNQTCESSKPSGLLLAALTELRTRHIMEGSQLSRYLSKVFNRYPPMEEAYSYPGEGCDTLYEAGFDHPGRRPDCSQCDKTHLVSRNSRISQDPMIHYGCIASGNQVMRDGSTREKLREQMDIICFEMEAAGIANVFPCLVIRGICDYSDSHKNKTWQNYAAITAACYAKEFLAEIGVAQIQDTCAAIENVDHFDSVQATSRTQTQSSSLQDSPKSVQSNDSSRPARHPASRLDSLRTPTVRHVGSHAQPTTIDVSQTDSDNDDVARTLLDQEAAQMLSAGSKDFREAVEQFESILSGSQRATFRSTTFRDVRCALRLIQNQQASRSGSMDLPRVEGFLESIHIIETKIEFDEKGEFLAYVLGTMKYSLEVTTDFPEPFDVLVKAYKAIGECIAFQDADSVSTSTNPGNHRVLAKMCADVLKMLRLTLRPLKIPPSRLEQAFSSTWQATLQRWEKLSQNLRWYKSMVDSHQFESMIGGIEQRRLSSRSDEEAEVAEAERQRIKIQHWLASTDVLQIHKDNCEARGQVLGSGTWLINHSKYVAWRSDDAPEPPILWLNGILGAGKTVLASKQRTSVISILRAIISQLLKFDHLLLAWCYDQYLSSNQRCLVDDKLCKEILKSILLSNSKTVVVLDGLDECEERERGHLIKFLCETVSLCEDYDPGRLRVMFVSRDEHDIRKALSKSSEISVTPVENGSDMKTFVESSCKEIHKSFKELDQSEIKYISESTLHRADGMFLFAKLVMANLHGQTTLEELREQLHPDVFPDKLDAVYDRILARISRLDSRKVAQAKRILGWMTCAKRALKWHEIQGALSIDQCEGTVDLVGRRSRIHIHEICGSLVSNLSGDRVELIHMSAKEYLDRSSFVERASAESSLASLCLNYLRFDCFEQSAREEDLESLLLKGTFAFQDYAAAHWSDHTYAVIKTGPSIHPSEAAGIEEFPRALASFVEHFELETSENAGQTADDEHLLHFQDSDHLIEIRTLFRYMQRQRARGHQALDEIHPAALGNVIPRIRETLECLGRLNTLTLDDRDQLEQAYGRKWYKCTKAACHYFHEGFLDDRARNFHVVRHEMPFRCPDTNCESGYKLGFATAAQREKHVTIYHPQHVKIKAVFARIKKDKERTSDSPKKAHNNTKHPATFVCDICLKSYTRREKLNNHLKKHQDDRLRIECSVSGCTSTFSRDDERKRHEKEVHGEKRFICTYELRVGAPGLRTRGCRKGFPRRETLYNHWRSDVGQACLQPLWEEEKRDRELQEQIEKRKAEGLELPLPRPLYDQFPDLRGSISGEVQSDSPGDESLSTANPNNKKWQPFQRSQVSGTASSRDTTRRPHEAQSPTRAKFPGEKQTRIG